MKRNLYSSSIKLILIFISIGLSYTGTVYSQKQLSKQSTTYEFKISTWNTEWLSCSDYGPTDESLQINNIATVIQAVSPDIIALQEVGTSATYATVDTLVKKLGSQWAGSIVTNSNTNCGQNQAIIYKKSRVQLVSSSAITDGGTSYNWSSGRYPVLYSLNLIAGENLIPVSLINIHAKAMSDTISYTRRKAASEGLKALLDGSSYNTQNVIIAGDYNDYLTGSQFVPCKTCSPVNSPYKNFVDDTDNYKGLTVSLTDPAYNNKPVIDNIIISNELFDNYTSNNAAREVAATTSVSSYSSTTSDHTPVSVTFTFSSDSPQPTTCEAINYSQNFSGTLGDFTQYSVTGTQAWYGNSSYGAVMSGYLSPSNYVNEDWLISPAFDLSVGVQSATLSFDHALNYAASATEKANNHTLWMSTDYTSGDPNYVSWTQLPIPTMASGNSWTFVSSGSIDIPSTFFQSNARFAFKYLSDTSLAGTWEIKNLAFNSQCNTTDINKINNDSEIQVVVSNKIIKISSPVDCTVTLYDIMGKSIYNSRSNISEIEIPVKEPGLYLLKLGADVKKIIVK